MRVTKKQLRRVIREALSVDVSSRKSIQENASPAERQKIESLWWNTEGEEFPEHPHREQAKMVIDALGVDPMSLKIWTIVYPWGELYEPWAYYGGGGNNDSGFTASTVDGIIEYFNSGNDVQLSATFNFNSENAFAELDTDEVLDMSKRFDISDGVEKAHFETAE